MKHLTHRLYEFISWSGYPVILLLPYINLLFQKGHFLGWLFDEDLERGEPNLDSFSCETSALTTRPPFLHVYDNVLFAAIR